MPPLSEQAKEDFLTWFEEVYGISPQSSQFLEFFRTLPENSPYYLHWTQFIYSQSASARAGIPPPPQNEVRRRAAGGERLTPSQFGGQPLTPLEPISQPTTSGKGMPETINIDGKEIPVNYVPIGTQTVGKPEIGENGLEVEVPHQVTLYAPVVPLENLTPDVLEAIYGNIFALWDTGELFSETPFAPQDITDFIPFDPQTGTGDLSGLRTLVSREAIIDFTKRNITTNLTPELEARIESIVKDFPAEGIIPTEAIDRALRQFVPPEVTTGEPGVAFDPLAEQKLAAARRDPAFRREEQRIAGEQFARGEQRTLAQAGALTPESPTEMFARLRGEGLDAQTARLRTQEATGGTVVETESEAEARASRTAGERKRFNMTEKEFNRQKRFEALKKRARQARTRPQRVGIL